MVIAFRCLLCRTGLSAPVREVPLPPEDEAPLPFAMPEGEACPTRPAPGTFAYDPEPYRLAWAQPPKRVSVPRIRPGSGLRSAVLGRGDVRGVVEVPGRRQGCCGPGGSDGPDLACAGCGVGIAVEAADCCTPQQVTLDPRFAEPVVSPAAPG